MANKPQIFYYSRHKLGMYLLFNLFLFALAILFTLSIFPDYPIVYYFALLASGLSVCASIIVFSIKFPLAEIDETYIKIDHNQPLGWNQIKSVEHIEFNHLGFSRPIIKITPKNSIKYKMSIMQKIVGNSQFGAFSIPLYAMTDKNAKKIENLINKQLSTTKAKPTTASKTDKSQTKKTLSKKTRRV